MICSNDFMKIVEGRCFAVVQDKSVKGQCISRQCGKPQLYLKEKLCKHHHLQSRKFGPVQFYVPGPAPKIDYEKGIRDIEHFATDKIAQAGKAILYHLSKSNLMTNLERVRVLDKLQKTENKFFSAVRIPIIMRYMTLEIQRVEQVVEKYKEILAHINQDSQSRQEEYDGWNMEKQQAEDILEQKEEAYKNHTKQFKDYVNEAYTELVKSIEQLNVNDDNDNTLPELEKFTTVSTPFSTTASTPFSTPPSTPPRKPLSTPSTPTLPSAPLSTPSAPPSSWFGW